MNQIVKQIEYIVSLMQDVNGAPYYMYGHQREIANRLLLQGKSPSKKDNRYPLIALRLDTSEQMNNGYISYNLNIGIFTNTSKSINAEERYAQTITPILTPIYEEFLYQLKRSGLFFWPGSQDRPPHTKIDRPFWGTDGGSGNDRYIFNDAIDAIEILDLRINGYFSPNCGTFSPPRQVGNINLNGVKIGEVAPFLTVNFDLVNSENTQITPVVSGQTLTLPDVEVVIDGVSLFYPYGEVITINTEESMQEYTPSTFPVTFDKFRSYYYGDLPASGSFSIDITDAKDYVKQKVLHKDDFEPEITTPSGIVATQIGTYVLGVENEIYFWCHKDNTGAVTRITYEIIPNI